MRPRRLLMASANEAVDFFARADIDSDSRFVQKQNARACVIPFREDDFLLVAARKISDADRRSRRLDREFWSSPPLSPASPRRGASSFPMRNAEDAAG